MAEKVLVALITTIGLLLLPVVRHMLQRRRAERMYKSVMHGLEATRTIYGLLHEIVQSTSAERVVLFAGHNSGGVPRPHSPFYVTALHWVCRPQERAHVIRDYQSMVVDPHYIGMLIDIERQGQVTLTTEHMPECHLKQIYESENVTQAVVFFIAITENKFLYLSVAKYEGIFDEWEVTRMRVKVMKMRPYCLGG